MKKEIISGYAPVNGIEMYYEIHGSGEIPLVLIHGGGSTIETSFGNLIPLFDKKYKLIAVELQAHGRTSDREGASSFEQDSDDVAGLLHHLKIANANFLGFSNGGNTAMQIAIRHPGLVNKLVIASSFYKREGMIPGFFEGMELATLDNMPALLKTGYLKVAPDKNNLQAMFNKDKERMLHFKDWKDKDMRSIQAPTFFIAGDQDVMTPEHTVAMFRLLPNAKLAILPGVHGAYIGEITVIKEGSKIVDLTVAMIEEFIENAF
jgi:pimeloyl-ACP methyl ester carboxylesterase